MKKSSKKLALSRETLHHQALLRVAGGPKLYIGAGNMTGNSQCASYCANRCDTANTCDSICC
jgi:hypothetical protein